MLTKNRSSYPKTECFLVYKKRRLRGTNISTDLQKKCKLCVAILNVTHLL